MTGIINWSQLRQTMLLNTHRIEFSNSNYWDKLASSYNESTAQMNDLTQKQLNRILLLSEYTVLDVGAGTGRLTIPLAKRAKHVTALEPSANMMALLKINAQKNVINNIDYVNASIENVDTGVVEPHDIVISSFSLLMVDVEKALLKMNAMATKGVYLFLSASKWMDENLQNVVYGKGLSDAYSSDYIYVYNILHDLGVLANVDIWDFKSQQCYKNLNDAELKLMELYHIQAKKHEELLAYLSKTLVPDDTGKLWLYRKKKAAMIWWTKTQ